ncbi:MAG TPA: hypothetical protein DEE98_01910 [Elusimicrobia bacterium]|nr:MAG: hypothetical protein A2278_05710 [Elusimicrobia bacterium RIFOXYA12_FULL_49_49]OGS07360.1 MAG: hypothetical protein A2204_01875 [Elusimicrobia bacterium RIFOXYA1_FULL_47_7]OGS15404.1 MAG: hypothetical protein A2251_07540 [Elusimicrobia bacterium RIFOXYA2_FULL_47_53]OGS26256.1 MAG: hypothetical protein A2339_01520 [Elusimicrobia bacterium RIFOXYB12_FULL_50_12]OGS30832.1 MAG: hypothetical protein A2323_00680 [Elusimicrobia bacterium RIFOXYB2_FULL_46_23]HBU69118.1 hypothetical protein [El
MAAQRVPIEAILALGNTSRARAEGVSEKTGRAEAKRTAAKNKLYILFIIHRLFSPDWADYGILSYKL